MYGDPPLSPEEERKRPRCKGCKETFDETNPEYRIEDSAHRERNKPPPPTGYHGNCLCGWCEQPFTDMNPKYPAVSKSGYHKDCLLHRLGHIGKDRPSVEPPPSVPWSVIKEQLEKRAKGEGKK